MILLFDLYQWCYSFHPLDVPEDICLVGGVKPSYSPSQFQVLVFWVLWYWTVSHKVSTEKKHLSKNSSGDKMDYN